MAEHDTSQAPVSYKDTLNLPSTDFPIRPQAAIDDPAIIKRWEETEVYKDAQEVNAESGDRFILHDGPPYANGNIHIGHAYNKVLKDIICKYWRMKGKQVPVRPGWDCHGLPIEIKVTQELSDTQKADKLALIASCRQYADHWINVQREEFKRLGVIMDWQHPYLTMSFEYESAVVRAFAELVRDGFITRSNKTVPWCPSCQTVLAAAEIEYTERKDPSIYVTFDLDAEIVKQVLPALVDVPVSLVVWTTTPWTIPLNRAVLLHPDAPYVVLRYRNQYLLIAKELAPSIVQLLDIPLEIVTTVTGKQLVEARARVHHPINHDVLVPIILDQSVQLTDGTAIVHCAPGAGPEDYEVGIKHNLDIYSPIDAKGQYTSAIKPIELIGKSITEGQGWVINYLEQQGRLLHKTSIRHQYPMCWRCHGPLIFRATKQWFINLAHNDLRTRALAAIQNICMVPEGSRQRFLSAVGDRLEWCISRQRTWGVPIPALLCVACDTIALNQKLLAFVIQGIERQGIEFWQTVSIDQLSQLVGTCDACGGTQFVKEQDIIDVWFESGVSNYAVLAQDETQRLPADVYIEGKDQHRAWFQSSLLVSMILNKIAPFKTLITHGFTVDAQGKKMSKSLGNVVSPQEMIDKLGTDGLRLWASSIELRGDAVISDTLIQHVQEVFRKIRNTARFLLSNLYDYNHQTDAVAIDKLRLIDALALMELQELSKRVHQGYASYDFTAVFHHLNEYCAVQMSTLYLDMVKDCLYVETPHSYERRSVQTVLYYILDTLTRLMAPVLSFTAEQLSDHYQRQKQKSIHLQRFVPVPVVWHDDRINKEHVDALRDIRAEVMRAIERLREKQLVKRSIETRIYLYVAPESPYSKVIAVCEKESVGRGETLESFLKDYFIVSQMVINADAKGLQETTVPGIYVAAEKAAGEKCPRCWQYDVTTHADHLCNRCARVLGK